MVHDMAASTTRAFLSLCVATAALVLSGADTPAQPAIGVRSTSGVLTVGGSKFRDSNRNGVLDTYEDWRRSAAERARDLVSKMTIEEKAGLMMHGTAPGLGGPVGVSARGYDLEAARGLIIGRNVTSMISRLMLPPAALAAQNNALQAVAETGRLGIPLTLSTDPRHHFQYVAGASVRSTGLSQWPETLGFGALNDPALVRRFGDIARQEYRALGFQMALSPQADLATEPRWPRVTGTFGEDPDRVGALAQAYVEGFQNGSQGLRPDSVATVVKHWFGYGAAKEGWDSHSYYGRFAQITEEELSIHIRPFLGTFAAKTAGVMPTYSIFENLTAEGKKIEQVGAGFNRWVLTDLLRDRYKYQGMVVSDWGITNDCGDLCRNGHPAGEQPNPRSIAMSWGVEDLALPERFAKGVNAGIDQFGGTEDSGSLIAAVKKGLVSEARVNESAQRILEAKFQLGLFENPYVDESAAATVAGREAFVKAGHEAQAKSMVLLENRNDVLPLRAAKRVLLRGVNAEAAQKAGFTVVNNAREAEVALIRTAAPHQKLHPQYFFGNRQNEGDLDFKDGDADLQFIRETHAAGIPVIVAIYLDRPAILTNVAPAAAAILANFGATDAALFDALTGRIAPAGKLPFELPRSMDAVRKQRPGAPHDSGDPLYPIFSGKSYR